VDGKKINMAQVHGPTQGSHNWSFIKDRDAQGCPASSRASELFFFALFFSIPPFNIELLFIFLFLFLSLNIYFYF
jgi:hypothetical protein